MYLLAFGFSEKKQNILPGIKSNIDNKRYWTEFLTENIYKLWEPEGFLKNVIINFYIFIYRKRIEIMA